MISDSHHHEVATQRKKVPDAMDQQRLPLQLIPIHKVDTEQELSVLADFNPRINEVPGYLRATALLWATECKSDSERENVFDFVDGTSGTLSTLSEGVRLLCLRELFRLHDKSIRSGRKLEKLREDLGWVVANVVPLVALGTSGPPMMRALVKRRFKRLSRRDTKLLTVAIFVQVIAAFAMIAVIKKTEVVIAIQGVGLLVAAWLTGKCNGIARNAWNDIMAGFALAAVLIPFVVAGILALK